MVNRPHYRNNLRHVVRPDRTSERRESASVMLADYEALYLRQLLAEYAAYEDNDVAQAYVEYIDMVVRDESSTTVELFAHTEQAADVIINAIDAAHVYSDDMHDSVTAAWETLADGNGGGE